jgi:sulfotransferase
MKKQYFFISGLPRSGSTLLSAILKQNPKFHAGISGSLLTHFRSSIEAGNAVQKIDFSEKRNKRILSSLVDVYYEDIDRPVIFDTNRLWTNLLRELNDLYPYTKLIICVRDIKWIVDSFERMHQTRPYTISTVFPKEQDFNVYTRTNILMAEGGVVRVPYDCLKSAMMGMYSNMLFFMEYDMLCKNPEGMMRAIYNHIDQPYFPHDFNNVESSYDEYDAEINMKGLHTTKKKVEWTPRKMILPPDVISTLENLEVWRQ